MRPPNTSSSLQPEDVSLFGPFKQECYDLQLSAAGINADDMLESTDPRSVPTGKRVRTTVYLDFADLVGKVVGPAYRKIFTKAKILNAYRVYGVEPFTMRKWREKLAEEKMREAACATADNASPSIHALLKKKLEEMAQAGDGDVSTDDEWGDITDEEKAARKAKKKEDRQNFKDWQNTRGARLSGMMRNITSENSRALQLAKYQAKRAKEAKEKENKATRERKEEALRNEAARKAPALLEHIDNVGVDKLDEKTLSKEDMQMIIRFKTGKVPTGNKPKLLDIIRTLCKD